MKNLLSILSSLLSHGENAIINLRKNANVFNNDFPSVADTAKQNIKYSHNNNQFQYNNIVSIQ